ncbi:MAG: decarboxylating NADP(+)-dependent phosphogluconate dehydrogenase [Lentisphaerae bacterium]|jgi:6-phosphogluconate dehydrogenase|nr:decarboxylating NADP(+)-dependent phosphogluconate dehydrogenase [Lentisphaerota bacterium]MBT5610638.1 decarboxylating NADP(+)-dependent phosphogluconate dehydrogenase [Lentisphaerota bacterium]MBT7057295.1 decarboxylating NADP(+)-dependent phosphogluconate dehydrogenase [Lentisphaerota bacterium]MBT7842001.1 decarboxylating NADP(+)-dependent phosphogluconate dehydrogenase [Lentisphaerota bacterium]
MSGKADIGVVGLAVMGENLILNMESKGFSVACYNRTVSKVDNFMNGRASGKNIVGAHSVEELCDALAAPRKIMLMVKAGGAVDAFIEQLLPYLDEGDIVIDGGNSHFPDTIRRTAYLEEKGFRYIGTGVSGGEEGALLGPSIMPGGSPEAWPHVKPILQAIAAKVDDGSPCCDWVGNNGAGHYVKMVHNGIEYGDMQMICEAYFLMKHVLKMSAEEMHSVFTEWNEGELDSYLIEISRDILGTTDDMTGEPLVEKILDTAGQKGTGKWTSQSALDLGAPAPTVAEAVFARCLSAIKEDRVAASKVLTGPEVTFDGDRAEFIEDIRKALYASKICSYAQGYQLLRLAAADHEWDLKYGEIALMWRGGCIIRAQFLGKIKEAFDANPELQNLLLAPYFKDVIDTCQPSWRKVIATAVTSGIPVPAFSSALAYYDGYRNERLPANLLQAQRDYFGAHTYERTDKPRGEFFHTNWTGRGGTTAASEYIA